jgi:hypothetical protein
MRPRIGGSLLYEQRFKRRFLAWLRRPKGRRLMTVWPVSHQALLGFYTLAISIFPNDRSLELF